MVWSCSASKRQHPQPHEQATQQHPQGESRATQQHVPRLSVEDLKDEASKNLRLGLNQSNYNMTAIVSFALRAASLCVVSSCLLMRHPSTDAVRSEGAVQQPMVMRDDDGGALNLFPRMQKILGLRGMPLVQLTIFWVHCDSVLHVSEQSLDEENRTETMLLAIYCTPDGVLTIPAV